MQINASNPKEARQAGSWLSIHNMMIGAGALILAAILAMSLLSYSTMSTHRIGGAEFVKIEDGLNLYADVVPPALLPYEAFSLTHITADSTTNRAQAAERLLKLKGVFYQRLDHWNEEMARSNLIDRPTWDKFSAGIRQRGDKFWTLLEKSILPAIMANDEVRQERYIDDLCVLFQELETFAKQNAAFIFENTNSFTDASRGASDRSLMTLIVASVALALFVAAVIMLGQRAVVSAIVHLSRTMASLAGGNLDLTVPFVNRRDEVGDMSRALEFFKKQAQENRARGKDNEYVIGALAAASRLCPLET